MATASLAIDRTSMSLSALVFSGSSGSTFGLMDLSEPTMLARTEYASAARFIEGAVAVASTWDLTAIGAVVEIDAASDAAFKTAYLEVVAALKRLSYNVTITKNGTASVYQSQGRGTLSPAKNLDKLDLDRKAQLYNLTIPVHPVPVS